MKKGQAIMEFMASVTIFIILITAAITYFRVLRSATVRQEVVRNIAFSKINNSGPLTYTVSEGQREGVWMGPRNPAYPGFLAVEGRRGNSPVSQRNACFGVMPHEIRTAIDINYLGSAGAATVEVFTYANVYRLPPRRASDRCIN